MAFNLESSSMAAMGGHLESLQWLRNWDSPCPWEEVVCSGVIQEGHLEVLQWLKREGCPWPGDAVPHAAYYGHREILEWLRSEGEAFDKRACAYAAQEGKLETLKWLRNLDPPCPWDKSDCRELAIDAEQYSDPGGHYDVMRYIDEQPDCSDDES